jgi:hypothetical protein
MLYLPLAAFLPRSNYYRCILKSQDPMFSYQMAFIAFSMLLSSLYIVLTLPHSTLISESKMAWRLRKSGLLQVERQQGRSSGSTNWSGNQFEAIAHSRSRSTAIEKFASFWMMSSGPMIYLSVKHSMTSTTLLAISYGSLDPG